MQCGYRIKLFVSLIIASLVFIQPGNTQPALELWKRPNPLPTQTVDGVTLRITGANWMNPKTIAPQNYMEDAWAKVFAIRYEVLTVNPQVRPTQDKSLLDCVTDVDVFGPQGERAVRSSGTRGQEGIRYWKELDPRLEKVNFHFTFLLPNAPPHADGHFDQVIEFKDLPIPTETNKPLMVNKSITTRHGSRITIEKVAIRTKEYPKGLILVLRALPPETVTDAVVNAHLHHEMGIIDDKGKALDKEGHSQMYTDILNEDVYQNNQSRSISVAAPSPGAKTFNLKLNIDEFAPRWVQQKWYRHFRLNVNLRDLYPGGAQGIEQPIAAARTPRVDSALDVWRTLQGGRIDAQLWTRDLVQPEQQRREQTGQGQREWVIKNLSSEEKQALLEEHNKKNKDGQGSSPFWFQDKSIFLRDDVGNDYEVEVKDRRNYHYYWLSNGSPIGSGEGLQRIIFSSSKLKPNATKLTLETTLEAVEKNRNVFDFENLPIPQPGQLSVLDKVVTVQSGAKLILRKMFVYDPAHKLPVPEGSEYQRLDLSTGLVVVFQTIPIADKTDVHFDLALAHDDQGRSIQQHQGITGTSVNVLDADAEGRWWTVFLLPPAPEAKHLNIRMAVEEIVHTGEFEKVVLQDLPIPVRDLNQNEN